jgi:hypothetical protein
MEIYLEFRMKDILPNGINVGLTQKHLENSIRWKKRNTLLLDEHTIDGAAYDIYPIGVYQDPDPEINLRTLIVEAVYRSDPTFKVTEQIGGFEPREYSNGSGFIIKIPLHITVDIQELNPLEEYIDNIGPMEGGLRAEDNGWLPWVGDSDPIVTAVIESNVVHRLYKFIPFACPTYITKIFNVLSSDNSGKRIVQLNGSQYKKIISIQTVEAKSKDLKRGAVTSCSK